MITYWQIVRNGLLPLQTYIKGSVINVTSPTHEELNNLRNTFKIDEDFLNDIMDIDERSRMEVDEGKLYLIYRVPYYNKDNGLPYATMPLGVMLSDEALIVVGSQQNDVLGEVFSKNLKKQVDYENKIEFLFHIIDYSTITYLKFLKQINTETNAIEQALEKSTKNEELHKLLEMEKCLVYFNTSLRSNEILIGKLRNSKYFKKNEVDEELVEDVIIEIKQAIEMTHVYSDINSGMMDAFASVISNNLNIVMKRLTIITIALAIPTMVASFFGMNIKNFISDSNIAFAAVIIGSFGLAGLGVYLMQRNKMT